MRKANAYKDCPQLIHTTDDDLLPPGTFSLNAHSLKDRARNTNDDIWAIADELHFRATNRRAYAERSKELGITYNPNGILLDRTLRTTHLPVDSYLRDWMHILVSGGVANSHIFGLFKALNHEVGLPRHVVNDYATEYTLPSKYGLRVSPTWLAERRFDNDNKSIHSFASYLLTLIPIIAAFLEDMVVPHGVFQEHARCFDLLLTIVLVLSSGAEYGVKHINLLAKSIIEHHKLFVRLYPDCVKTKLHQVLHLPELYLRLRKILACFVATMCL